ncbi:MAG: hypothetical protein IJ806_04890 [Ruminococcus sp.]|nr:hypothetical protein [Ruminococcus sp.]
MSPDEELLTTAAADGTRIYTPLGKRFSVGEDLAGIGFGGEDDTEKKGLQ